MLDPVSILGVVAAASQLIEQSGKMVLFFSELYWKVQDTPDLIRKQKIHIEQLTLLSRLIKENPSLQTAPIASILQSCLKTAQPLYEALTKISISDGDGKSKRIQKVISALIKEKHISASLGDLEREKNSLILCIQEIDSKLLHAIQITAEEVKTEVGQVSLVVNDTARDMKEVVQSLPEIAENVRDMHQILPDVARDVQAIMQFTLMKRRTTFRTTIPVPETHTVVKSFYMVPNRRVRGFIGREDILEKIEDGFSAEGRPCVMVIRAMGGQGKTQVALEYCHRAKDQRFKAIFWLDAMSESSLRKGFRTIAEQIKPPEMIIDDDSGVDLVLEKLGEWPEPWLMILDNYDDPKMFNNLQEYMPGEDGCFLVTTRHADTDAMTDPENVIELPGLDERSALDLLFKQSQIKETETNVEEGKHIVGRLGFHPLAITQAGTYMKLRKIKLHDFLVYYKRQRLSILQQTPQMSQYRRKLGKLNHADTETALNVFTTWELSFQLLLASETSGTSNTGSNMESDLLTLFAFFDCKDISEELFKAFCCCPKFQESRSSTGPSLSLDLLLDESGNWDDDKFAGILIDLYQHALLQTWSREPDGFCHFSLHPLIKDWILLRTDAKAFQTYYVTAAATVVRFLETRYIYNPFRLPFSVQKSILSHIDTLFEHNDDIENWKAKESTSPSNLLRQVNESELWFAGFLFFCGRYKEAEEKTKKVLEWCESKLGLEDKLTLFALDQQSSNYVRKDMGAQWVEVDRRRVRGCEKVFGREHIQTFMSYTSLFSALVNMHLFKEAESVYEDHVKKFQALFGPEHPETLFSCFAQAELLMKQQRYQESETLLRRVIDAMRKVFESEHVDIFTALEYLALSLNGQKKYQESESLFREIVEHEQKMLGLEHPQVYESQMLLGWTLVRQERYVEAEALLRDLLFQCNRMLGPDDPLTIDIQDPLATALQKTGKYSEAEAYFRDTMERRRRILGPENSSTLSSQGDLVEYLYAQMEYGKAELIYREIAEVRKKILGADHADTLRSQGDEAACLYNQMKYQEAAELMEYVVSREEVALGPEHEYTITDRGTLSQTYMRLKKYAEAEGGFSLVFEQRKRLLGAEDEATMDSEASLAEALQRQDKDAEASDIYRSLVERRRRILGPEHFSTVQSVMRYGQTFQGMGMYDEAEALYRESLSADTKARGGEHAGPLAAVARLAEILRLQKKNVEEEKVFAQLTASLENALGGEGQIYIPHFHSVGERLLEAEQYGQAEAIFRIVARVREKALGPENAETVSSLQQLANTLFRSKRYRKASEIFKGLLATSEKLYGPEAQENVKYIWRLADSLRHDRKNVEADHLYERLLPRLIKSPAWEGYDREILDARTQHAALLGDQGSLLIGQGKWVEAEAVFRRLVQLRELINPSGAIDALIQLGTILQEQGKWSEAEGICGQISELLKKFDLKGRKNKKMRKRVVRLRKLEDMIKKQEKVCKVEDVWKSVLELRPEADEV